MTNINCTNLFEENIYPDDTTTFSPLSIRNINNNNTSYNIGAPLNINMQYPHTPLNNVEVNTLPTPILNPNIIPIDPNFLSTTVNNNTPLNIHPSQTPINNSANALPRTQVNKSDLNNIHEILKDIQKRIKNIEHNQYKYILDLSEREIKNDLLDILFNSASMEVTIAELRLVLLKYTTSITESSITIFINFLSNKKNNYNDRIKNFYDKLVDIDKENIIKELRDGLNRHPKTFSTLLLDDKDNRYPNLTKFIKELYNYKKDLSVNHIDYIIQRLKSKKNRNKVKRNRIEFENSNVEDD
ncbi:hypothetical protein DLAC_06190 [Tieghemostelium lacteum]|uniref:Uncharacterized protein n=1 Tax=Tieghemostelium lacteum TaxID=361077 RepID=A0A151ZHP9_TIELA|nr:hypothetical protein DLAC_07666 [Tieghemostelium lacteum]KYQ91965.1 hypothetical protein DLAC_06780 [Tieghemostelium lacteum]KYQ93496.1 hypothetical protein DLAC_06190 [Tieghemostelium lacteum]|eukprot:KYQ91856.1 hypothetical protein DLAC_07666 [Tieghemostelium lacteum]